MKLVIQSFKNIVIDLAGLTQDEEHFLMGAISNARTANDYEIGERIDHIKLVNDEFFTEAKA